MHKILSGWAPLTIKHKAEAYFVRGETLDDGSLASASHRALVNDLKSALPNGADGLPVARRRRRVHSIAALRYDEPF